MRTGALRIRRLQDPLVLRLEVHEERGDARALGGGDLLAAADALHVDDRDLAARDRPPPCGAPRSPRPRRSSRRRAAPRGRRRARRRGTAARPSRRASRDRPAPRARGGRSRARRGPRARAAGRTGSHRSASCTSLHGLSPADARRRSTSEPDLAVRRRARAVRLRGEHLDLRPDARGRDEAGGVLTPAVEERPVRAPPEKAARDRGDRHQGREARPPDANASMETRFIVAGRSAREGAPVRRSASGGTRSCRRIRTSSRAPRAAAPRAPCSACSRGRIRGPASCS